MTDFMNMNGLFPIYFDVEAWVVYLETIQAMAVIHTTTGAYILGLVGSIARSTSHPSIIEKEQEMKQDKG